MPIWCVSVCMCVRVIAYAFTCWLHGWIYSHLLFMHIVSLIIKFDWMIIRTHNLINQVMSLHWVLGALCNNETLQDFLPLAFLIISELPHCAHIPTGKCNFCVWSKAKFQRHANGSLVFMKNGCNTLDSVPRTKANIFLIRETVRIYEM